MLSGLENFPFNQSTKGFGGFVKRQNWAGDDDTEETYFYFKVEISFSLVFLVVVALLTK